MRYPEHDSRSSVSPELPSEAGPSKPSNGHTTNGVSGPPLTNGALKHATKSSPSRVNLPGTTLYEDSNIDREEFIRLVIQSLRDVGYTCVFYLSCEALVRSLMTVQRVGNNAGGGVGVCHGNTGGRAV